MAREKPSTPPPDPPEICARIRQLREEAGVKQHVLGLVSGVPLNTISEIAQGRLPMKRTVLRLAEGCRFLGCDVTGLVGSVPTQRRGLRRRLLKKPEIDVRSGGCQPQRQSECTLSSTFSSCVYYLPQPPTVSLLLKNVEIRQPASPPVQKGTI